MPICTYIMLQFKLEICFARLGEKNPVILTISKSKSNDARFGSAGKTVLIRCN